MKRNHAINPHVFHRSPKRPSVHDLHVEVWSEIMQLLISGDWAKRWLFSYFGQSWTKHCWIWLRSVLGKSEDCFEGLRIWRLLFIRMKCQEVMGFWLILRKHGRLSIAFCAIRVEIRWREPRQISYCSPREGSSRKYVEELLIKDEYLQIMQ